MPDKVNMVLRKLYHVTPSRNVAAILRDGVDPRFARGHLRSVWAVTGAKVPWAVVHVRKRHKCRNVTVLEVYIDQGYLIRFAAGVYRTNLVVKTAKRL